MALELKVQLAHKGLKVHRAFRVDKVLKAPRVLVLRVLLAPKALRVHKVQRVLKEPKALLEQR